MDLNNLTSLTNLILLMIMKAKTRHAYIALFLLGLCFSCKPPAVEEVPGIFRPLFLENQIVVTGNTIDYVWYGIKGARSYTFEISVDTFRTILRSVETEATKLKIEGLNYEQKYQARIRANSADGSLESGWKIAPEQTVDRRVVALVLQPVDRMEVSDNSVRVRWDKGYVVDSLHLSAAEAHPTQADIGIRLSATDITNGYYEFKNLTPNLKYQVVIFNSKNPSVIDRPYNAVYFQTSGLPSGAIAVGPKDNLAQLLTDANNNADVPDGATFYLPSGGVYYFANFASGATTFDQPTGGRGITFTKSFNLVGSSSGTRPRVYITSDWKLQGQLTQPIRYEGIDFEGLPVAGTSTFKPYLFNINASTSVPSVSLVNCRFTNLVRAIISCNQDDATPATVGKILIDNCVFTSPVADGYGILHGNKNTNNFLSDVTITNSTFANMPNGKGIVANVNKINTPVRMTIANCTFYNSQAPKESFLDLSAAQATLTIQNCLFASSFESTMVKTSSGTVQATFNYATAGFTAASNSINPTILTGVSAADLMAKPDQNDFTIKLKDSPVYSRIIGDPRWIK